MEFNYRNLPLIAFAVIKDKHLSKIPVGTEIFGKDTKFAEILEYIPTENSTSIVIGYSVRKIAIKLDIDNSKREPLIVDRFCACLN